MHSTNAVVRKYPLGLIRGLEKCDVKAAIAAMVWVARSAQSGLGSVEDGE